MIPFSDKWCSFGILLLHRQHAFKTRWQVLRVRGLKNRKKKVIKMLKFQLPDRDAECDGGFVVFPHVGWADLDSLTLDSQPLISIASIAINISLCVESMLENLKRPIFRCLASKELKKPPLILYLRHKAGLKRR